MLKYGQPEIRTPLFLQAKSVTSFPSVLLLVYLPLPLLFQVERSLSSHSFRSACKPRPCDNAVQWYPSRSCDPIFDTALMFLHLEIFENIQNYFNLRSVILENLLSNDIVPIKTLQRFWVRKQPPIWQSLPHSELASPL